MKTFNLLILSLAVLLTWTSCANDSDSLVDIGATDTDLTLNGSYSRILVVGDYLYGVDDQSLITYDITDRRNPTEVDRSEIGLAIETIYHHDGNLFIGSRDAMYTYTIGSNGVPVRRGLFNYANLPNLVQPCDPVVADASTAYSTLYTRPNTNAPCGQRESIEALVVMDITDLNSPSLIAMHEMQTPRGLSLDGNLLFVCNDTNGLTIMDVSDPAAIQVISRLTALNAWDAIAHDSTLVVVGLPSWSSTIIPILRDP